jgi:hypothetical protein
MVASLLKGMSEAIEEYAKGGGFPTDGVVIAGREGGNDRTETRDYRSGVATAFFNRSAIIRPLRANSAS